AGYSGKVMTSTSLLTDRLDESQTLGASAGKTRQREGGRTGRLHFCRRSARGFWLGGLVSATAGVILGAYMPYQHHVEIAISVIWWGVYFGCFGASIGALVARPTRLENCDQSA